MPDFDDSFLSYCERTERKRKHSYNFNSARNSSYSLEKGGQQQQVNSSTSGSRSNLLATAKSYSKTLPRSFRKNLQKISQYIRDSGDGDLHFYDLNHNELPAVVVVKSKTERVKKRSSDKVISIVDFNLTAPPPPQVELLANRSIEEKCLAYEQKTIDSVGEECDNEEIDGCQGVEDEGGQDDDGEEADDDEEATGVGGGENTSAVVNTSSVGGGGGGGGGGGIGGAATPSPSGHKGSLRGTKIARRARSFKDDFLEKISQMRTPSATMMRTHSPSNSPRTPHNNNHHLHHTLGSAGRLNKGFDDSPPSPSSGGGSTNHATGHNSTISQIVLNPNYTKTLPLLSSVSSSSGKQDLNYYIRQVRNSLKHFNDVVAKNKLEMLPGNGTVILDNLTDVHTALQAYALNERSSALISAKRQVYAALGELIKLCDEFWFSELTFKSAKGADQSSSGNKIVRVDDTVKQLKVKEVTELMEAALTNLIQVSHEKLQEQNAAKGAFPVGLLPTSHTTDQNENLLQRPVVDAASQRTSLPDIPLTPRERDILQSKANNHNLVRGSHSIESVLCDSKQCNNGRGGMRSDSPLPLPPPKPPLPNRLSDAPPLPPKRKTMQQLAQQFSHPVIAANYEADFMAPLERISWRSKSPEDNSSLLSVSAGSLDSSTLNQSREDLFELDQLAAATNSSTSSSKSPSQQYQYQQLDETPQQTPGSSNGSQNMMLGGATKLPTVSVTGTSGEGVLNGNDTRFIGSNGCERVMDARQTQQNTQFMSSCSSSSSSCGNIVGHHQTITTSSNRVQMSAFTNRTQYAADRFQTLYSSANVRVRVMPLSVSQDSFVVHQQQIMAATMSNGSCSQQLIMNKVIGDSCTLTRGIVATAAGSGEEEVKVQNQETDEGEDVVKLEEQEELPPKLPEKQRKNSSRDRHKSIYDNMSPTRAGGAAPQNCDEVDNAVELRDKVAMGMIHHQHEFQKVTITKHQSAFEPRQMQSFRTAAAAVTATIHGSGEELDNNGDGEEHPPPLPYKKRHMFQSVAYSVMAYMEMIGNYSATTHHPGGGVGGELLSYDARAIAQSAEYQQRSVSMMPSLNHHHHHNYQSTYGSSGTPSLSSSSTTATFSSNSTSLSGAISNLTVVDEKPPALPPKRSRLPSGNNAMSPPHSPLITSAGAGLHGKGQEEEDWGNNPQLMKNISSLSPIICVCDNSAPPSYEESNSGSTNSRDQEKDHNRASVESENGVPSPNTSQLYKHVSRTSQGDRSSNGSELANSAEESDENVVMRRDLKKQESKLNLLEETNVQKYLVLKKETEEGPDIKGGHMDALIIHATKVEKISDSNAFGEAFITTFRTFITPFELLKKLTYRYEIFHCQVNGQKQRAAKEVFSLLVRVVNDLTMPDIDQCCLNLLMDFVYQLICNGNLSLAKVLRLQIMTKVRLYQSRMPLHADPLSARGVTTNPPTLIDLKSSDIAEQMTLLDSELFQKIEIPEVLLWAQEQCEEKSPNLTKFTEHFNKMSYWARSQILKQEDGKEREKYVIKFIKIMKHLRKINNYNSYLALLSALDSAPIRRLEWHKTIREGLKEYCALIDSSSSFRAYRLALAETNPPCIPYIGLVLQDLTFVHIGNPDYIEEDVINFSKRWQQYNIVVNMKRFRSSAYPFKKSERIIGFFENFENYLDEDAMWQISENIKPRGGRSLASVK